MARDTTSNFSPSLLPARQSTPPPRKPSALWKAFPPIPTTSRRASELPGSLGNGKTVIRAGYGFFYDHPALALAFLSTAEDGSTSALLEAAGGAPSNADLNNVANIGALKLLPFSRESFPAPIPTRSFPASPPSPVVPQPRPPCATAAQQTRKFSTPRFRIQFLISSVS